MHIGLIDIDGGKWPNLALMKLSAYWKQQGATTELIQPNDVLKGQSLFNALDKIYGAVVFDRNKPTAEKLQHWYDVEIGGSGWSLGSHLAADIEEMYPNYDLYPTLTKNTAYGFLTRGCPRNCPFCIVSKKEGLESRQVADLDQFWRGQKYIKLLDPNLLACTDHERLLKKLIDSKAWVDFTQGVDARLLTASNIELINACKIKMVHFAWDNPKDNVTQKMLIEFRKHSNIHDFRKLRVYVLTNYQSTHQEDLHRIYWLRENGYDPYIMIYDKPHAPQKTRYLQRWVNNKRIFRTVDLFDYYDHRVG